MKKIISYSLYNDRPKDVVNAVVNCFLAEKIFPEWICRFHIDETVPIEIIKVLKTFKNVEIKEMPKNNGRSAMFWRFLPSCNKDVDIMISRDADSWLSYRELVCVQEFEKSDKGFHIIRDHCYHSKKIMGGMWGCKKNILSDMGSMIEEYLKKDDYDQGFLEDVIYPIIISNSIIHTGEQYNINHKPTNGYFDDGGVKIPFYDEILIDNFSFVEVNQLNGFMCIHCNQVHKTFIGGIMNRIPNNTKKILYDYFSDNGVSTDILERI